MPGLTYVGGGIGAQDVVEETEGTGVVTDAGGTPLPDVDAGDEGSNAIDEEDGSGGQPWQGGQPGHTSTCPWRQTLRKLSNIYCNLERPLTLRQWRGQYSLGIRHD